MSNSMATVGVGVSFVCDDTLNYAFQQNDIPVVKEMCVRNDGVVRRNLVLRVFAEPAFVESAEFRLEELAPFAEWSASPLPLRFNPSFLATLRERVRGRLTLALYEGASSEGQGTQDSGRGTQDATQTGLSVLPKAEMPGATASQDVALLAPNEWCGLVALPEILAAFILPNDPAVAAVLSAAADKLGAATGRAALNGYQDKSRERVRAQAAAIFAALAALRVRYSNPPASFETTGQKVRFPSEIVATRLATCLDLALFAAACLEQAGLRPLVLIHEGHAYAGVWLEENTFEEQAGDDLRQVRKYADAGQLAPFECTLLAGDSPATFADAEAAARVHLATETPFRLALDVYGARRNRIRPLPFAAATGAAGNAAPPPDAPPQPSASTSTPPPPSPSSPPLSPKPPASAAVAPEPGAFPPAPARVARWKARLLDLSLRNRLLNFKETRSTFRILCDEPAPLEDLLAGDEELTLLPRPRIFDEKDPRTASAPQERADALAAHLREALTRQHRIHTGFDEAAHRTSLTTLFRAARLSQEENGANTLFVAVGVMEWRESEHAERVLRAPLVLIPVELRRRSALEAFTLRRLDEETRVNSTLLEMLRQEFQKEIPGLDPLPGDESGVDIAAILEIFRAAVLPLKGWEVRPEVWLGQFSFTKHLLWKDLADRLDVLRRNRSVARLLALDADAPDTGAHAGAPLRDAAAPADIPPHRLDDDYSPAATLCPRSADSSQLAAVMAAAAGLDFVLEGPPGTGKSQTITNIIAHCLAEGKRVLFVAEKRVALDVVHRRLCEDGLAPFCLELHSNKTGKADVLAQLRDAVAAAQSPAAGTIPDAWQRTAAALHTTRDDLNAYVRALHQPAPCGVSAHDCFDHILPRAAEVARAPRLTDAPWDKPAALTADALEAARETAARLAETAARVAPLPRHPLTPVACEDYSPLWAQTVPPAADALANAAAALLATRETVRRTLAYPLASESSATPEPSAVFAVHGESSSPAAPAAPPLAPSAEAAALRELAVLLDAQENVAPAFYTDNWADTAALLAKLTALAKERETLRARLHSLAFDEARLAALDIEVLHARWSAIRAEWFAPRFFHSWSFRRQLRPARAAGTLATPAAADATLAIEAVRRIAEIRRQLTEDTRAAALIAGIWNSAEPASADIERVTAWGAKLHATLDALDATAPDAAPRWRDAIAAALAAPASRAASKPVLDAHRAALDAYLPALATFAETARLDAQFAARCAAEPAAALAFTERLPAAWPKIREWCAWRKARAAAVAAGLAPLVARLETLGAPATEVPAWLEDAFHRQLLPVLLDASPPLRAFLGSEHEQRIRRFRELDTQLEKLARDFIHARLAATAAAALADGNNADGLKQERALLNRELAKKMRHIPVRQLLARTPALLAALKPCVLMSPLSVAQYLEPAHRPFDIVIFDEASQIPVWDAVGAIARGTQLIVVGDPKQLPPTSFFATTTASDDDEISADADLDTPPPTEDLESILDELLATGFATKRLQWHYRSRHESLIQFSNQRYYANTLLTFPSADAAPAADGIHFHHLPTARYDKASTRTNPIEARALVAYLVERLTAGSAPAADGAPSAVFAIHGESTPAPARSFGIVTFSLAQQQLIENLLDAARRENPALEPHFGANPPVEGEPVFVKNLENVQGDERDVILFSIGYGLYDEYRPRAGKPPKPATAAATPAAAPSAVFAVHGESTSRQNAAAASPDARPRVTTNFGPLNREGGERRLNVAITRAKHEVHLFSSITSQDLQEALTTTRARGVHDLRHFLAHAQRTSVADVPASTVFAIYGESTARTSPFVAHLAARIRQTGFVVHENVGTSDYRIDLAIVDPANPRRYLLGVECDGPHYRSAATARDRDKLRSQVLRSLGWNLFRLWTPDYHADPDGTLARLLASLK